MLTLVGWRGSLASKAPNHGRDRLSDIAAAGDGDVVTVLLGIVLEIGGEDRPGSDAHDPIRIVKVASAKLCRDKDVTSRTNQERCSPRSATSKLTADRTQT